MKTLIKLLALLILIFGAIVSVIMCVIFFLEPTAIKNYPLAGIGCGITGMFGWMYGMTNLFKILGKTNEQ